MRPVLRILLVLLLFNNGVSAQVVRQFTPRYYNPSVKGNIVYVSNSIISTSGVSATVPGTGEVSPAGTSWNNAGVAINIDVDNPAPTVKIPFGSVWNYQSRNNSPASNGGYDWKQPAYILTSTWNVGASPVAGAGKYGYNSGQTTCIPSGRTPICSPSSGNKYKASYFRNTVSFTAAELSTTFTAIQLDILRNDGIVVYINGVERVRNNMPTGSISYGTYASYNITPGGQESLLVDLSTSFFTAGVNTIAVEVHLSAESNVDMSFDMAVKGINNAGTFNSSTADLNLATCSSILFAGLYWGAGEGSYAEDSSWIVGETTCKLKLPGASSYTTITSSVTEHYNNTIPVGFVYTGFQCFANITSLLNTNSPNGTYAVADVLSPLGKQNSYGGWTIVIVYANPSEPSRNLTVFDGCAVVNLGSPPVDFSINGFLTPPTGPVSCELGAVTYDGDRAQADSFLFKQNGASSFYNLTPNATSNLNDMWNSTISYKGTIVTTRNPAFNNTLGYDASIVELPNAGNAQLGNSKTSATVRVYSPSEFYIAQVLTTAISQYNPTFNFDKTATDINGGSLVPGDSIRYQINYDNTGNDSSTNTIIYDNIPPGSTFLPGSIKINGVTKTDASTDDQAEYDYTNNRVVLRVGLGANASVGGNLGPAQSGNVQFSVVTATSCDILSCATSVMNEAKISYNGKLSGTLLYDSSGVSSGGCVIKGPVISTVSGSCFSPKDTLLVVHCPIASVNLPWQRYAGYSFYSAMPFIPANLYNQLTPVTSSGVFWAYYNSGNGCTYSARIQVIITTCPDIDDDDDGIPDYVEFNDALSLQDVNGNGIPNWNDPAYPGYVDHNTDGYNDNFDWGADSDNDGIPNFQDTGFWLSWIDTDADGVNDRSDKDLDGIPNQYDRDNDNDGIPDVVESYGVDTDGDGKIDNYTDTDFDGLSQNVDANNTGVSGSGLALGAQDLDGDGIANYLDTDSDNDGIPDIVEAEGVDSNNNGNVDGFTDGNGDGITDDYILATGLLKTGTDVSPVDGRADNYPNKNKDRDVRPNAFDLDSDGDGIADVIEAGLPDADFNGRADGSLGTNGWTTTVSALPALALYFTDADPYPDYLDIDSDEDGIPDNIEGMSTTSYLLPGTTDTDGDGLVNTYDNSGSFGGSGIYVYDHNADGTPDYRDADTDGDGIGDIVEGNDFNLNGMPDDNVSLTGLDTDGDGLDNRFDSLNSVTNLKGTSYRMGNAGSFTGDASPGSRTTVQKTMISQTDRDWRFVGYVLPVQFLNFRGTNNSNQVYLSWTIIADKEVDRFEVERSTNNSSYTRVATLRQQVQLFVQQNFSSVDDITQVNSDVIYYRLKVIGTAGAAKYSNVLVIRKDMEKPQLTVRPNPASSQVNLLFNSGEDGEASVLLYDNAGKLLLVNKLLVKKGYNTAQLSNLNKFSNGLYEIKLRFSETDLVQKLLIKN